MKAKNQAKGQFTQDFGTRLKAAVYAQPRVWQVVAEDAGIVPATFRDWMDGRHAPCLFDAYRVARTLGITLDELVGLAVAA